MFKKRFAKIEWLFWMCIGGLICFFAWRARLGSFRNPGPGFVAFASGFFVFVVGLVMLLSRFFSEVSAEGDIDPGLLLRQVPWTRLAYTVGLLSAYSVFLGTLGYLLATFLLMLGLLYDPKKHNYVTTFLSSAVIVGGTYLVFEVWLQGQFPRGVLPWW